uniref:Uncharacterized protein n=1 Tax=Acrobeloides nanus TaxID=290746 RepID=A0A914DQU6_9BILA
MVFKKIYNLAFSSKWLLLTNTISCTSLLGLADSFVQRIDNKVKNGHNKTPKMDSQNWFRTARVASMGLALGPMNHFWYKWLDSRVFDRLIYRMIGKKILADMLISPFFAVTFIAGIALLEGKSVRESLEEYRRKFFHVLTLDFCVWPPTQAFNFWLLPPQFRVLYVSIIQLVYNCFMTCNMPSSQIEQLRHFWVADALFHRHNRSVKYVEDGNFLVLAETAEWADLWPRLISNLGFILLFIFSILFNFALLLISLSKSKQTYLKKVQCLIANLAFCNIIFSSGLLIYTFLIDVYYDVDSFEILVELNSEVRLAKVWPLAKVIHYEMVDNFALAQTIILLMISVDRYCSLFPNYSPFTRKPCAMAVLSLVPYLLAMLLLDTQVLAAALDVTAAVSIRLVALIAPPLLALVFTVCSVIRLVQKAPTTYRNYDLSCSLTLLLILLVQLVEKFSFFLELLSENFHFEITMGNAEDNRVLHRILHIYFVSSHYLLLLSPLYIVVFILAFAGYYRSRMIKTGEKLAEWLRCKRRPKLDYSTETMRSIIAEQSRARQMRAYSVHS